MPNRWAGKERRQWEETMWKGSHMMIRTNCNTCHFTFFHVFGFPHLFVHILNVLTPHSPPYKPHPLLPPKNNLIFLVLTNFSLLWVFTAQSVMPIWPLETCHHAFIVLNFLYAHKFYFLSQKINSWKARIIFYTFFWILSSLMGLWYTFKQCVALNRCQLKCIIGHDKK